MSDPGKPHLNSHGGGRDWYKRVVEASNDVVLILDSDWTVNYVNTAVNDVLGYEPDELLGEDCLEYVYSEDYERHRDTCATLRASPGESQTVELRLRSASQSWCWVEAQVQNLTEDDVIGGLLVTIRDVTERKEREAERNAVKERMKMALKGANLGVWDWNMETDEVQRDELLTNMLGYTKSEMGDDLQAWEKVVHPEGKQRHNEALAEHIANRTPHYECEYRLQTKSGDWKWVRTMGKVVERDEDGTPVRAVGIHQDIDEQKRTKLALEEERDMFKEGPAVVFKWEDTDGWPIEYVSENVEDVLGYSPEALQSGDVCFADFVHDDDLERVVQSVAEQREQGADRFTPEPYRIRDADGDVRWVMEYTHNLQEDNSHLLGYIVDITERKQRELELQQYKKAVDQSAHAIYITDDEGTIEYVNPAFETVTGYSETEAIGETPRLLQSGEYSEEFYNELWQTILSGDQWDAEILDERADGEEVVLNQTIAPITDDDGTVRKFVAVAQDITDRKAYEEALEEAREELRQVIDLIPDVIFVTNQSGEYLLANETATAAFGTPTGDIENASKVHLDSVPEPFEMDAEDVADVIESGEPQAIPEQEVTVADGDERIFQTTKIPFETAETGEDAVLSYGRDVTELKEQERELQAREEKYRTLFEDTRDALMLMDRDGYLDCNEQALELFGVDSPDEFVDYSPWEFSPPTQPDGSDSKRAALERIDQAFEEGEAFFEWSHQRVDGTVFPAEVKLSRFEYEGEQVLQALVRDITERKEHKQQLTAERNRIRAITNAIPDVTIVYDRQGRYQQVLTGQRELPMEDVPEFEGEHVTDVLAPDVAETILEGIEESLTTGTVQTVEYSLEVDGEQTWFEGRIAPMPGEGGDEAVLLARDITARKEHERELKAREAKYRALFENTRDALMLLDRDGFFDCNERALDLFEFDSVDDFVEQTPWELSPPTQPGGTDSKTAALEQMNEAFEKGEAFFEWRHQRADGTEFPAEVKLSRFQSGGEPALHALVRDITERKEYQQQLEEQRDNLDVLNQVLRHDIRNDLQLITAYAELLVDNCEGGEAQDHLETVLESANHAVELTLQARNMADVMVSADEELQRVTLRTALEDELTEVRATYPDATITADSHLPRVSVQATDMLGSVFRNLLKNAIQHNDKDDPEVTVSATVDGSTAIVRIADNGPGVPDGQKDGIFGKGETGLESSGTGIGLYLVKTLVESYGGDIRVEDNDPEGAVFVVELPTATSDAS